MVTTCVLHPYMTHHGYHILQPYMTQSDDAWRVSRWSQLTKLERDCHQTVVRHARSLILDLYRPVHEAETTHTQVRCSAVLLEGMPLSQGCFPQLGRNSHKRDPTGAPKALQSQTASVTESSMLHLLRGSCVCPTVSETFICCKKKAVQLLQVILPCLV